VASRFIATSTRRCARRRFRGAALAVAGSRVVAAALDHGERYSYISDVVPLIRRKYFSLCKPILRNI
jgi:hypothetical protein